MIYSHAVFNLIGKHDKVLDVGGAAMPFRRADWVLDCCAYEDRARDSSFLQGVPEHFNKETWLKHDVCERFPFEDKFFDFVVCGHLLEDVRDPIAVVRELQRVARRGYIEVPTRFYEQLYGLEHDGMCGAGHHRWITDLKQNAAGENELVFIFKPHWLHSRKELQIRKPYAAKYYPYIGPRYEVMPLVWNGGFNVREDIENCISGSTEFFEETVRLSKTAGKNLFDKEQTTLVESTKRDIPAGIHSIDILGGDKDRSIMLYNAHRNISPDVAAYETDLLQRLSSKDKNND